MNSTWNLSSTSTQRAKEAQLPPAHPNIWVRVVSPPTNPDAFLIQYFPRPEKSYKPYLHFNHLIMGPGLDPKAEELNTQKQNQSKASSAGATTSPSGIYDSEGGRKSGVFVAPSEISLMQMQEATRQYQVTQCTSKAQTARERGKSHLYVLPISAAFFQSYEASEKQAKQLIAAQSPKYNLKLSFGGTSSADLDAGSFGGLHHPSPPGSGSPMSQTLSEDALNNEFMEQQVLMEWARQISENVSRRDNVTIVNRGTQFTKKSNFSLVLLDKLLGAISPWVERALQIVADEIAKDRQMQRLLSNKDDDTVTSPLTGSTMPSPSNIPTKPKDSPASQQPTVRTIRADVAFANFTKTAALVATPRKPSPQRPNTARSSIGRPNSPLNRYSLLCASSINPIDFPQEESRLTARRNMDDDELFGQKSMDDSESPFNKCKSAAQRQSSVSFNDKDDAAAKLTRKKSIAIARKNSVAMLQGLSKDEETAESSYIKNNGWGTHNDNFATYEFNGVNSYVSLPGVPNLESVVRQFSVDFWMKTPSKITSGPQTILYMGDGHRPEVGMQLHLALNWNQDYEEEHLRLYVRDHSNRVLEVILMFSDTSVCNGEHFHHFRVNVKNLEEGIVTFAIDGEQQDRLRFLQSEHPNSFQEWNHRLYLGGFVDEGEEILHSFEGSLLEVRFSHFNFETNVITPFIRWPLIASLSNQNPTEAMKAISEDSIVTLHHVHPASGEMPRAAPYFDGSNIIKLSTLGPLGDFMNHFSFEARFRTTTTSTAMCLMGVSDSQHLHAEMGVILNAEPLPPLPKAAHQGHPYATPGKSGKNDPYRQQQQPEPVQHQDRWRYKEYQITVFLQDVSGRSCVGMVRFSEKNQVMDGRWHTLVWKVIDSEANKMELKVDGVSHEVLVIVKEGPRSFVSLRDWVCLGGYNVRSWKVKHPFKGIISHCGFHLRSEPIAQFDLNEGPGSCICVDKTGHGFHGIHASIHHLHLAAPGSNVAQILSHSSPSDGGELASSVPLDNIRHTLQWIPIMEKLVTQDAEEDASKAMEVIIHKNNFVQYSILRFVAKAESNTGRYHEEIHDVMHNENIVVLEKKNSSVIDSRLSQDNKFRRFFYMLPQSCWVGAENAGKMKEHLMKKYCSLAAQDDIPCHIATLIQIGDCQVTLFDVRGPRLPHQCTFDGHQLRYQYPIATGGSENKKNITLNNMLYGFEKLMHEVGSRPTAAIHSLHLKEKCTVESILESLDQRGFPWGLAAVAHNCLMNAEFKSILHTFYSVWSQFSEDEGAALVEYQNSLMKSSFAPGVATIQRNWRGKMARRRVVSLENQKMLRQQRVEEIESLRKVSPFVLPKKKLKALVISLLDYKSGFFPPIQCSYQLKDICDALEGQGYVIQRVENPTRPELLAALNEGVDPGAMNFVYVVGYGGSTKLCYPPHFSYERLEFCMHESAKRQEVASAYHRWSREALVEYKITFDSIKATMGSDRKKSPRKGQSRGSSRPPTKQQKEAALAEARKQEDNLRLAAEDLFRQESEQRTTTILREYDHDVNLFTLEFRLVIGSTMDFERKYAKPANLIHTSESKVICPYANVITTVEDVVDLGMKLPSPPNGFQSVVAVDLFPCTPNRAGISGLFASTGHSIYIQQKPHQRCLLSWHLRKALNGYATPIHSKMKDASLFGGVDCGQKERDWRSFAKYLLRKLDGSVESNTAILRQELEKEVPYVGDLVPIRKVFPEEEKKKKKNERSVKRVSCSILIAMESSSVSFDLLADTRGLIPDFSTTDVVPQSICLLTFRSEMESLVDETTRKLVEEYVDKCAPDNSVKFIVKHLSVGIQVEFTGGERPKITQTMNQISQRSRSWRLRCAKRDFLEVYEVDFVYAMRGTTTGEKWKHLLKREAENPKLSDTVRVLSSKLE